MQRIDGAPTMDTPSHTFCFPVKELENDLLKLIPFDASLHSEAFIEGVKHHPEVYAYLPWGPFQTGSELQHMFLDARINPDSGIFLYAVMDKKMSSQPTLAGMIGFLNSSVTNLCTELGLIITLPVFQRTYVTTNAIGLLLHRALDLPDLGGLGLRRVQWQASVKNQKSINTATKLGFRLEGVQRWQRALPSVASKAVSGNGIALRVGDPRRGHPGRDTAVLAMCWDDWEGGCRAKVDEIMKLRK